MSAGSLIDPKKIKEFGRRRNITEFTFFGWASSTSGCNLAKERLWETDSTVAGDL